jgi:AmmeMemoRadiSam system protein B
LISHPKLRYVEVLPVELEQKQLLALHDPLKIAADTIVISPDVWYIFQYFDGQHSIQEILHEYFKQFNAQLTEEQLNQIVRDLDARQYLESPGFQKFYLQLRQDYRALTLRPAAHAGHSYPADSEALKKQLAEYFQAAAQTGPACVALNGKPIQGIIAPHIDIQAGGAAFAAAYQHCQPHEPADLYIILGTGHQGIARFFACSGKDFETPLGTVKTDRQFLDALQTKLDFDIFSEELLHKNEHTIEFQTIFLQYLFGAQNGWKIVPILSSFSPQMVQAGAPENRFIRKFLSGLKTTIQESGKRVVVIASADFAHVGPRYGDQFQPSAQFIKNLEIKDLATLGLLEQPDSKKFCANISVDVHERRICGFPPIFSLLSVLEATHGKILTYDSVKVDNRDSTVSFASMLFY